MEKIAKENVNDIFFDGWYKEIWREIIPEELTAREIDFMMQAFSLKKGDSVLDLMCGYGRHAINLARKGLNVTAVDNLKDYISEIEKISGKENLSINCVENNIQDYCPDNLFDLVICMGNSLNFFNKSDTNSIIYKVSNCLKPAAKFLIHTWSLTEIVAKNFKEKSWSYVGSIKFLSDSRFYLYPSRIESDNFFIDIDGKTERKIGIDYILSLNEIEELLTRTGLRMVDVYSIPGKKKFALGDPRAYIVAEKL